MKKTLVIEFDSSLSRSAVGVAMTKAIEAATGYLRDGRAGHEHLQTGDTCTLKLVKELKPSSKVIEGDEESYMGDFEGG